MWVIAALVLLLLAVLLLWQAGRSRRSLGMPSGRVVYSDMDGWNEVQKPLYDSASGLTGKPDYIVEQDGVWIPVEVKSSAAPVVPYDSHIYQLASYCLLVERTSGVRPPHGLLRYRNRTIEIAYTPELEQELVELLEHMRLQDKLRKGPARSHEHAARCARCGFRETCDQALEDSSV